MIYKIQLKRSKNCCVYVTLFEGHIFCFESRHPPSD